MKEYQLNLTLDTLQDFQINERLKTKKIYIEMYIGYEKFKTKLLNVLSNKINI